MCRLASKLSGNVSMSACATPPRQDRAVLSGAPVLGCRARHCCAGSATPAGQTRACSGLRVRPAPPSEGASAPGAILRRSAELCVPRHPAEQTVSPPLSDLCLGVRRLHLSVSLTKAARLDLRAWLLSLSSFNGRSLLDQRRWLRSPRVVLETDAAVGIGLGAVCGRR